MTRTDYHQRLSLCKGGGRQPYIIINSSEMKVKSNTSRGYDEIKANPAIIDFSYPTSTTRRGRLQDGCATSPTITHAAGDWSCVVEQEPINTTADGNAGAVLSSYYKDERHNICDSPQPRNGVKCLTGNNGEKFRIRKLTERECFRLMGVRDCDIDKIQSSGISKTQQYKMAGNSIVCDVLVAIFKKMFIDTAPEKGQQLTIF